MYPTHLNKQYDINYIQNYYTTLQWSETYNFIMMIYCGFGVISSIHRNQLLHQIHAHLQPYGIFLFDVFINKKDEERAEYKTRSIS